MSSARIRWIENPDSDTQAFIAGKDSHLILCFRGTRSGQDALTDVNFLKTNAFGGRGRVHRGFQQSLDGVWAPLQAAVDALGAGKKIFLCGHSLGAALAQLAAHRLALGDYKVANVYVFGSPRIGNEEFRDAYNALLEAQTFLHINHEDIVTQLPPSLFGFHYVGVPPRRFNEGHIINNAAPEPDNTRLEVRFEELDSQKQEEIQFNIAAAQRSIRAATRFLHTAPQEFSGASYSTTFERGAMDDHSMDQYLFKFGCAIVDGEWERLRREE
jgi:pimeloyl-ACP methyl ester carboxylesterase